MTRIDLFDLYQKLIAHVNQAQGGFIRPQVNFENWLAAVNNELFRDSFSEYEKSQRLSDEIKRPFLKSGNVVAIQQPGQAYDKIPYPELYEYFASASVFYRKGTHVSCCNNKLALIGDDGKFKPVDDPDYKEIRAKAEGAELTEIRAELVDNQRFDSVLNHRRKGPTKDRPYITQYDGGFKIAPKGIGIVVLDYLRTPTRPVFAFTPGTDDTVIYNLGASTQLDWSNVVENEFISRLAMKYSMYTRDEGLYKLSANENAMSK